MSEYTRQDTGTLRITIREAAYRLGVTEDAIRKRIQRGSLEKDLGSDGRVYVYIDQGQDISHPKSQVHRDPMVDELVEELKDRVAFLERALDRKSLEAERYQQIVAGLTQTNKLATQLSEPEAPGAARGTQSAEEGPDREMCARVMGTLSRASSGCSRWRRCSEDEVRYPTTRLARLGGRKQAARKGQHGTALVIPSAPEVTRQLDPTLAEHELLAAEEYLLNRGHIAPADLGLTWATYTITPAGLDWLDEGLPWPSGAPQTPAADMEAAEHGSG